MPGKQGFGREDHGSSSKIPQRDWRDHKAKALSENTISHAIEISRLARACGFFILSPHAISHAMEISRLALACGFFTHPTPETAGERLAADVLGQSLVFIRQAGCLGGHGDQRNFLPNRPLLDFRLQPIDRGGQ